ncbi:MAG: nucleotide pyrophosphohydrolase [Bdellovibrionales bacterium]|nr:nucleotide pyrophosphohydrolase [Bdellovibrionales bacterium]
MRSLAELSQIVRGFRDERDWKQFHTPKDMVLSLLLEAGELAEHFQWKSDDQSWEYLQEKKEEVSDEIADIFYWVLLVSHDFGIDLEQALQSKMAKNREKYPIERSRGKSTKYSSLKDENE